MTDTGTDTNEDEDEIETNEDEVETENDEDEGGAENNKGDASVDDPENSVRLNRDIGLEPMFNDLFDAMTQETFIHYQVAHPRPTSFIQVRTTIDCLFANLIRAYLRGPHWFLAIPLRTGDYTQSKIPRYRDRGLGHVNVQRVMGWLLNRPEPLISIVEGINSYRVTRIRATAALLDLLGRGSDKSDGTRTAPAGVTLGNISNNSSFSITGRISLTYQSIVHTGLVDCIRLKGPKVKDEAKPKLKAKASLIDYPENAMTGWVRQDLKSWNTFIRSHLLDVFVTDTDFQRIFKDDGKKTKKGKRTNRVLDLTQTQLYRVFSNSTFAEGGRYYGGWPPLPQALPVQTDGHKTA